MTLDEALAEIGRVLAMGWREAPTSELKAAVSIGALWTVRAALQAAQQAADDAAATVRRQAAAVRQLDVSRTQTESLYRRIATSLAGKDREALLAELDATREECRRWNARATELEETLREVAARSDQLRAMDQAFVEGREEGMRARLALGPVLVEEPEVTPPCALAQWAEGWRRGWGEAAAHCERDYYRAKLVHVLGTIALTTERSDDTP